MTKTTLTSAQTLSGPKPAWLTFDCYGTLAQWDEGLLAVVREILQGHERGDIDPRAFIEIYDRHEHEAERSSPHRSFKEVSAYALGKALVELGMQARPEDAETLTSRISSFPPFPEVPDTLRLLKQSGFSLCIISNTDNDLIAGNVAQMGGAIDKVISAEQAQAYKPSPRIFTHAHRALGVETADIVHICASPHLDLAAARDMGFRCVWVDRGTGRAPLTDYVPDAVVPSLDRIPPLFRAAGWM